uniref:PKD domain-containing protein n=1 Tax=Thiothrix sp. TaxID=1032 RepID=UPI00257FA850
MILKKLTLIFSLKVDGNLMHLTKFSLFKLIIIIFLIFFVKNSYPSTSQEVFTQFQSLEASTQSYVTTRSLRNELLEDVGAARSQYLQAKRFLDKNNKKQATHHLLAAIVLLAEYQVKVNVAVSRKQLTEPTASLLRNSANTLVRALWSWVIGNQIPQANAGADQTAKIGKTVLLDGSQSSDADQDNLSFQWSLIKVPNGSRAKLKGDKKVTPSFVPDRIGQYVIQLVVSDGRANSLSDRVTVEVRHNNTPIANAGMDQTVHAGKTVTLDGSASSDADGDRLNFLWTISQKPQNSMAQLSDKTALMPTFVADKLGPYTVKLQVTDGVSTSSADVVVVTTQNSTPVASAGADQRVKVGDRVVLNGSSSTDVDGDALTYHWEWVSKPAASRAVLNDVSAAMPSFNVDYVGQYVLRLVVGDAFSLSPADTVVINGEDANTRPIARAGEDQRVYVGNTVTLSGSGSSDADTNTLTYRWAIVAKPQDSIAVLVGEQSVSPNLTVDKLGQYVIQLIVNDGQLDSEADQVIVSTLNSRPIAEAGENQAHTVGTTVSLDGSASHDADGDALSYRWSLSSKPADSNASLSQVDGLSPRLMLDKVGTFVAQLLVSDGNLDSEPDTVTLVAEADTTPPFKPDSGKITLSQPDAQGKVMLTGQVNSVEPGATVIITNTRTGESVTVIADREGRFTAQLSGQAGDVYSIVAKDPAGNNSETGIVGGAVLPPDPVTVATQLDETAFTSMAEATAFLYTGTNPIQTGVAAGVMDANRIAVIRGQVFDKDKKPLSGVVLTVKDHPEFGQTLSRTDGAFDLAVNGGGLITLNYTKPGYLDVQRQVETPWREFSHIDDAVLITVDPVATLINLADTSQDFQVAKGSMTMDADGERQATILFPQGTVATMTLADGSQQVLGSLTVRATEYTVGEYGEARMPAPLPPASAYTYAVELSVDEAVSAGAKRVDFSQPLPVYVDNFLGFPTGEAVPAGWYDAEKSAWIPSKDGVIIKILREDAGKAILDVTKDDSENEATQEQLDTLGITVAELERLAGLYDAGKSLWRVPVTHFTPWDFNWPYGPPPGADGPPNDPPKNDDDQTPNDECEKPGCTISVESQTLGETFDVSGTPFSLNYSSGRVSGRTTGRAVTIPLSGNNIPSGVEAIQLTISIAGQIIKKSFDPEPNKTYHFVWNGKDGYGRDIIGSRKASISVGYRYPIIYYSSSGGFSSSFGNVGGGVSISRDVGRVGDIGVVLQRAMEVNLHAFTEKNTGLGAMSMNIHHAYDPTTGILYTGNGKHRSGNNLNSGVLDVFAGGGTHVGDGRNARETAIQAYYVAEGTDGSIYFTDTGRIRRVNPNGIVESVVGNGEREIPGRNEGEIANAVPVGSITNFTISPTNRLYFIEADEWGGINSHIRYVDDAGNLRTLAHFEREDITDIFVDENGYIYLTAEAANTVVKLNPDGSSIPLINQGLYWPWGVKINNDGKIYVSSTFGHRIVTMDKFGTKGEIGISWPQSISFDEVQNLYISTGSYSNAEDGIYKYLSETDSLIPLTKISHDGTPPNEGMKLSEAKFYNVRSIYYSLRQSTLFIPYGDKIFKVKHSSTSNVLLSDYLISSDDGSEVYHFDGKGRHLRTLNAVTNTPIYTFAYDDKGLLSTITDADGDVTRINRDAAGKPLSIVAADGQETRLTLNADGYIQQITDVANQTHQMTYTTDGLMTQYIDPRGNVSTYEYDPEGRLLKDHAPTGGGWTLARTQLDRGIEVSLISGEGRLEKFKAEYDTLGGRTRTNRSSDGLTTVSTESADGNLGLTLPDGTKLAVTQSPDPRFGMQSPYTGSSTLTTPAGLVMQTNTVRTVTLGNPDDVLSLQAQVNSTNINGKTYITAYDATAKMWTETSAENRVSVVSTDTQGRPVHAQTTGLHPASLAYDSRGRLQTVMAGEGSGIRTSTFAYHADGVAKGYLASITDAEGRTTQFEKDAVGRTTQQTLPDGRSIGYSYDANGNLASLTPPGRSAHVFNYTAGDQTGSYTPPQVNGADTITQYTYNKDKQLTQVTRPDGKSVVFNRNATNGKLDSIALARGDYTLLYNSGTGKLET